MSKQLGLAILDRDYRANRIAVMEHFSALSRKSIVALSGFDPVADPNCLANAWNKLAEVLEVDLLWGSALSDTSRAKDILDWDDGEKTKHNHKGEEVVQWGIFHAVKADGGRHFRHIPQPQSVDEALDFDPTPFFPESVEQLQEQFQQQHDRYLARNGNICYTLPMWYTTAFHFPLAIFGLELLCFAGTEEDRFARLMDRFVAISKKVTTAWSRVEGLKGFILHDDLAMTRGPVFRPQWYRRHIFPHYAPIFSPLIEKNIPIIFTSDGNCNEFIDDIFQAGADGLNFEYLVDLEKLVDRYPDKLLIGNLNSQTLAAGPLSKINEELTRCIEVGSRARRFVINVGGQLTHDIPPEHLIHYLELRKKLCRTTRRCQETDHPQRK